MALLLPAAIVAALVPCDAAATVAPDLLVLMHGSGKVERYDLTTGRHRGAFIRGVPTASTPSSPGLPRLSALALLSIGARAPIVQIEGLTFDLHEFIMSA